MILTCPQCSTQFHVDPQRIADAGTKVRCARCKQVFSATKPLSQPPSEPGQEPLASSEPEPSEPEPSEPEPSEPEPSEPEPSEPEQTEITTRFHPEPIPDEPEMPTDIDDGDFDYDRFQELDADGKFSDIEADTSIGNGDNAAEYYENTESSSDTPDQPPAENFEPFTSASPDDRTDSWQETQKTKPYASLIRILLLLILAILIIAGVMVFMNGPDHLNQMLRQHFGQQVSPPSPTGQMVIEELEGKFIINEQAGELFLIRGNVTNRFNQAQSAVQVKGVLHDQHGKPLAQKTVFCGNPLTDDELRTLPFSELEQRMGNQFGRDLINMNIASGKTIPFAIVFRNLPESVSEFSVAVTASNPADQ